MISIIIFNTFLNIQLKIALNVQNMMNVLILVSIFTSSVYIPILLFKISSRNYKLKIRHWLL